jgi:hypothetical protein
LRASKLLQQRVASTKRVRLLCVRMHASTRGYYFLISPSAQLASQQSEKEERAPHVMMCLSRASERGQRHAKSALCDVITLHLYILLSLMPPTWLVIRPRFLVIIPDGKYIHGHINKCRALSGVHIVLAFYFPRSLSLQALGRARAGGSHTLPMMRNKKKTRRTQGSLLTST